MKIYLAGPMRGLPGCNFAAFDEAKARWLAAGHHPVTPTDLDRLIGHEPTPEGKFRCVSGLPDNMVHTVFSLLTCVCAVEAIALLPGWEKSVGASMELAVAQFMGLKVFDGVSMVEIIPKQCPWNRNTDWRFQSRYMFPTDAY